MTFAAGQSGNPGGRPRGMSQVRALARKHTADAIAALAQIMGTSESDLAKVGAANALLDRGWGKATQHIEGDFGVSIGLAQRERVAADIDRIFGLAGVPADDPKGGRVVVSRKAPRSRKARAGSA